MRILLLLVTGLLGVSLGSAQTWLATHPDQWQRIKRETQSDDWRIREAAFHEIHRLADRTDPEVASALFNLLTKEIAYRESLGLQNAPPEGWGDPYMSTLTDDCKEIYEKGPSHDRFHALAAAPFNPDSPWARFLGAEADDNIDWLLGMCKAKNPYHRANAAEILGQWVRFKKPPAGPRRAAVVAALNAALDDHSPMCRRESLTYSDCRRTANFAAS
jgi:hypothetical protein